MNKRFEMNMELEKIKDEKVESYCIKGATDNSGSDSEQNESELEDLQKGKRNLRSKPYLKKAKYDWKTI